MVADLQQLIEENTRLRAALAARDEQARALEKRVLTLTVEVQELKRRIFGPKAERVRNLQAQLPLLELLKELGRLADGDNDAGDRAEALLDELNDEVDEQDAERASPSKSKKNKKAAPHGRRKLEETPLPVERVVLEPVERLAPGGDDLVKVGEEVTQIVEHRPSSLVRIEVVRPKYLAPAPPAPTSSDEVAPSAAFFVAEPPELPIPKSMAGRASSRTSSSKNTRTICRCTGKSGSSSARASRSRALRCAGSSKVPALSCAASSTRCGRR